MSRVAIVGSRDFADLGAVREFVNGLLPGTSVVSGGARGVDREAENEARRCGLMVLVFRPDWDKHGKRAGFIRNEQIVAHADEVVAFWDGESKGTAHTIGLAERAGKPVRIIRAAQVKP